MKTSALLSALALAVAAMMTACGGGDDGVALPTSSDLTVDERAEQQFKDYFASLAAVMAEAETKFAALDTERAEAFDPGKSESEREAAAEELVANAVRSMEARRDMIINVRPQPPAALQGLHLTFGGAADDALTAARRVAERLVEETASTEEQYDAMLVDAGADTAASRFQQACAALQAEAGARGIEADLRCGG